MRHRFITLALLGAVAVSSVAGGSATARAEQVGIHSPFPSIARALRHVTSFETTTTVRQHGHLLAQATITTVRQGAAFSYHAVMRQSIASGESSYIEMVLRGPRACARTTPAGPYHCGIDAATVTRWRGDLDTLSGVWEFAHPPTAASFTPAPGRMIGARACVGYTFHPAGTKEPETDVLYLAKGDHLPCELIETGTTGGADSTWSRYNDPGLVIPSVG